MLVELKAYPAGRLPGTKRHPIGLPRPVESGTFHAQYRA